MQNFFLLILKPLVEMQNFCTIDMPRSFSQFVAPYGKLFLPVDFNFKTMFRINMDDENNCNFVVITGYNKLLALRHG